MVVKGNDVIGLKVLSVDDGKEIESVEDIIYDPQENRVKALLVEPGGWFSDAQIIPIEAVVSIGNDAVLIKNENVIRKASEVSSRISHIAKDDTYLTKTKIVTEHGDDLGKVSDIIFDSTNGKVLEFEVSQGVIKNIQSGKKFVKIDDIITVGEDATIVKGYTEDKFDEQAQRQGLQGTINRGADEIRTKAPDIAERSKSQISKSVKNLKQKTQNVQNDPRTEQTIKKSKQKISQGANTVSQKLEDAKDTMTKKFKEVKEQIDERRRKDAIGKYVTKNILTPEDEVIAYRGDIITNDLINNAEKYNLAEQILMNATSGPITPNKSPKGRVKGNIDVKIK